MSKGERYEVLGGRAATVELTEAAVLAKALRDVAAQVKDAIRTLARMPIPREIMGMKKLTSSILASMAVTTDDDRPRRPPTGAAIDRADVVIECLFGIEDVEVRKLLVVRGVVRTWQEVLDELGLDCSIRTIQRRHDEALVKMMIAMMERDTKKC